MESSTFFQKIKTFVQSHKILSGIGIIMIVLLGIWSYKSLKGNATPATYILTTVKKGTLTASVSGAGQVSVSDQTDIKSKVSGDVTYVGAIEGNDIKAKALLIQLDAREAQKTVRDAQSSLDAAKITLEKLKKPTDALSMLQAKNSLSLATEAQKNAEENIKKSYEEGFNDVSNAFLDLPNIMAGLQDILYGKGFIDTQDNVDYYVNQTKTFDEKVIQYRTDAETKYRASRKLYDKNFQDFKASDRSIDPSAIEALIKETYETTKVVADAAKATNNLIQFYEDKLTERNLKPIALADTHLTTLSTSTGKLNTHLTTLLNVTNSITTDEETIVNSKRTIDEKTQSLVQLKEGTDPLDIQSQELTIKQKQNALYDANQALADYYIRAPFAGTVAEINVKKGDSVSSGTVVATLITKQRTAVISLNEVDVAKVKLGQKGTLTFDAIEGLTLTGDVIQIDTLGTVSQGVVTYGVTIGFDTQDSRIKPGMSVSAAIITDVRQDVLVIPVSAIKTQGNTSYVELLDKPYPEAQAAQGITTLLPPRQLPVQTGISNDTSIEILSGLKAGDQIIIKTITSSAASASRPQTPSLFPTGGRGIR